MPKSHNSVMGVIGWLFFDFKIAENLINHSSFDVVTVAVFNVEIHFSFHLSQSIESLDGADFIFDLFDFVFHFFDEGGDLIEKLLGFFGDFGLAIFKFFLDGVDVEVGTELMGSLALAISDSALKARKCAIWAGTDQICWIVANANYLAKLALYD